MLLKPFQTFKDLVEKKQSVLNLELHYNVVHRIGRKNVKRLAVMFFFVRHKRCIGLAINMTLNCSIALQRKHLYNIFIRSLCKHCVAVVN